MSPGPAEAPRRPGGLPPNVRGALWMVASALCFTAMTTLIKYLGADYPAALQTFYRQAAGFLVLLPVILHRRGAAFATPRLWAVVGRSGVGVLSQILAFYAFQMLPLAQANALSFTRTLWIVPLAGLMLHEKVGLFRTGAVLAGFLGVLIMLRPGAGAGPAGFTLSLPILAMLASGLFAAVAAAGNKLLMRDHTPTVLVIWSTALGLVFSLPGALIYWRWPEPRDLLLLCAMGVLGIATQGLYIKGLQQGDAAAVVPVDYTRLVFAALVGFFAFREIPTIWTIAGSAVVVASTLLISLREMQVARRAPELSRLDP